jgi:hypothetical protein
MEMGGEIEAMASSEIPEPPAPPHAIDRTWWRPRDLYGRLSKKDVEGRMTWDEWNDRVKNADFTLPEITEQNLLILTFAKRRTGKTYDDAEDGLASMARGEYNAFNYDLVLPPWIDPKYYIRFKQIAEVCFLERIRIHIDEGTAEFDCHDWQSVSPAVRRWISELGKYQQCCRICVQVAKSIDPSFRDQCDKIYSLSRWWKFLHKVEWVRHIDNPNIVPPWESESPLANLWNMRKRLKFLRKRVFAAFNTYQHFMTKAGLSKKEQQAAMIAAYNASIEEKGARLSEREAGDFLSATASPAINGRL